jgi:hypothetical protein
MISVAELKLRILKKVNDSRDADLLAAIEQLLSISSEEPETLTDERKKELLAADKEIDEGKFLTDRDANGQIDEWLGK